MSKTNLKHLLAKIEHAKTQRQQRGQADFRDQVPAIEAELKLILPAIEAELLGTTLGNDRHPFRSVTVDSPGDRKEPWIFNVTVDRMTRLNVIIESNGEISHDAIERTAQGVVARYNLAGRISHFKYRVYVR